MLEPVIYCYTLRSQLLLRLSRAHRIVIPAGNKNKETCTWPMTNRIILNYLSRPQVPSKEDVSKSKIARI